MTTTRLPAKESAGNLIIFKMTISVNRLIVFQSKRLSRIRNGDNYVFNRILYDHLC